jgi:phosphate/sulfate permease
MSPQEISQIGFSAVIICIFGYIICTIITMVLQDIVPSKYHWKIYLKKNKKYEGKIDPIYKVKRKDWEDNYKIVKWELAWVEYSKLQWLLNLLFYPINIYIWKYNNIGSILIGNEEQLLNLNAELKDQELTIGDQYEYQMKVIQDKNIKEDKRIANLNNVINNFNTIFDENYE